MSKELPYFRFTPQEWQNKNISLEDYAVKGLFIDICSFYWIRDCSITLAMLKKRFSDAVDMIDLLVSNDIIELDNETDFIQITFLNEQYDMLSEKRKRRQQAGSKGGKKKSSNAKAMLKQKSTYKDKDNNKDKDNKFNNFISIFNELTNKRYTTKNTKARTQFNARIKDGFTIDDFKLAIINCKNDDYHRSNALKYLTPEFITRADKLERFLNAPKRQVVI